jgi:sigma-E factor negative regulatory protein RseC
VADYQDKEIEIATYQNVYSPGQEVTVLFQESKGFAALFYGYLFPFIIVLLTLIITSAFTKNELFSGLLSLGILIPYYTTLYFFRHLLKKVFKFEVEETI